jgi:hypothetical protein
MDCHSICDSPIIQYRHETRVKSSVLWITGAKSSVLFLMGAKSSVLLVLCTLAVELRNGGRHPFGDCTLRMELSDSHISHSLSSILYVQYCTVPYAVANYTTFCMEAKKFVTRAPTMLQYSSFFTLHQALLS